MKAKPLFFMRAAVIVLAVWWIYQPVFHGGWLWDDDANITGNSLMRDPGALWKIWFAPQSLDFYPLQTSVQWIQWHLWGMNTLGYHLTNIGLQLLNAFLLWSLLRKLGLRFAWLGGMLFAVHPTTLESVAWISELKNTLSMAYLLLAMGAWVDWTTKRRSLRGAPSPPAVAGSGKRMDAAAISFPCCAFWPQCSANRRS